MLENFIQVNEKWYRHKSGRVSVMYKNFGSRFNTCILWHAFNTETGRIIGMPDYRLNMVLSEADAWVQNHAND